MAESIPLEGSMPRNRLPVAINFLKYRTRAGIFKRLRSSGIDAKELIPSDYVAWRASTTTRFLLSSKTP
jgi:hypothetical protein